MNRRNPMHILLQPMRGTKNVPFARIWRAVLAEAIATMFFVFFVGASVEIPAKVNKSQDLNAGSIFTALTQGLTIIAVVAATARLSGGHINPAVSFCLMWTRAMPLATAMSYIAAQCVGAIAGSALFYACIGDLHSTLGATTPHMINTFQACLIEFMITSMLLFVVLGTAVQGSAAEPGMKPMAPIPIGFSIVVGVLLAGNLTGGSMNPARSLGPAVVSGTWTKQWVYWVGPLLASIVVGSLYKLLFLSAPVSKSLVKDLGPSEITVHGGRAMSEAEFIDRTADDEGLVTNDPAYRGTGQGMGQQDGYAFSSRLPLGCSRWLIPIF
ncbi:aquaporin-like protein [Gaertneriomyces semiglobifer]|nr:aquaporin-like protein [Gaertneriomyces semiglobifer]